MRLLLAPPAITSPEDLKGEICKIANSSIALANKCFAEQRNLTEDEAFTQVAQSISLLKAIKESTED